MFIDAKEMYPMKNITDHTSERNHYLYLATYSLGWICAAAWSSSFYAQVYMNWKRKSVVGLSFDFVAFNVVGFLVYSAYVISLLWIPAIQAEYKALRHDKNPSLQVSDAVFSLHALLLVTITLFQTIIYERGGQRVSEWTRVTLVVLTIVLIVSLIVPAASSSKPAWTWLGCVDALSYIKVVVTVLKYWPQVLLNYRRQSTEGWSVYNVILDFGGGWVTLIQMFIDEMMAGGYKWPSSSQNIIKYWLCVITLIFDSIFLVQHYALYSRKPPEYQRVSRILNGVLEPSERGNEENGEVVDHSAQADQDLSRRHQINNQRVRGASHERHEAERIQQRMRSLPSNHVSERPDDVVDTDTTRNFSVGASGRNQNVQIGRLPGEDNAIHGAGHPGYQARVNSLTDIADDVSINSPSSDIVDNNENERRPMLTNERWGTYGSVYSPDVGNMTSATDRGNPREMMDDRHNLRRPIFHGRSDSEVERLQRDFQDLGIHFT